LRASAADQRNQHIGVNTPTQPLQVVLLSPI
jgi:hypothetical protein